MVDQRYLQISIVNVSNSPFNVGFSDFRSIDSFHILQLGKPRAGGNFFTLNPGQTCQVNFGARHDGGGMFYFYFTLRDQTNVNMEFHIDSGRWNISYNQTKTTIINFQTNNGPFQIVNGTLGNGEPPGSMSSDSVTLLCYGPNLL